LAALHTGGATIGRSLPATRTSDAGGTGLACLARPMWRSAVEDRLAFVLFRVRTAAKRPRKASVPAAAAMGTAICSGRASSQGYPYSGAVCAGSDLSCDVQDDRRPGTDPLAERTIVRSFHAVENLVHVTVSATVRVCPCRLDDESQHKKEKHFCTTKCMVRPRNLVSNFNQRPRTR